MKITIISQADPFFLAPSLNYLIESLPRHTKVVSTVLFNATPFCKKESFLQKAGKTVNIFGARFFVHYGFQLIINKFKPEKSVSYVLQKHGIPIIKLDKSINHPESLAKIASYEPDLLVSIAGNQIFKKPLIELTAKGCLNLHSALLPKYRGLMPSFWVLKNNENETGVSVFFVDEGIDSGPIVVQRKIEINSNMTHAELIKESKRIGMDAIIEAIELIHQGNSQMIPNPDNEMTYYSFPKKKDVKEFYKSGKKFY